METCTKNCSNCKSQETFQLQRTDIDRLLMMGYYDVYFSVDYEGAKYMRKFSTGECVFLKNGSCMVWDRRPSFCVSTSQTPTPVAVRSPPVATQIPVEPTPAAEPYEGLSLYNAQTKPANYQ